MPENVALGPDGTAYVTFAAARQVAAVTPSGTTRILATLPAPADGGVNTPVLGFALTTGIVRMTDGTLYFLYASGDAATTGLYRLRTGGARTASRLCRPPDFPTGWRSTRRRRGSISPTPCSARSRRFPEGRPCRGLVLGNRAGRNGLPRRQRHQGARRRDLGDQP
ncbi:hypothetical protein NKG94_04595 [Micromonospora sp. M12]